MTLLNFASRTLLNFASFNLGWWACALGPMYGYPWLGPAILPVWVGLHVYFSPTRLGEILFLPALAVFGFFFDSLMIYLQIFQVRPQADWTPAWLVAMWVLLGLTFESMLMLRRSIWLVCLAGVVSGPLSYFFAEAVHILDYTSPKWLSMSIHAMIWAILMPLLFLLRDALVRFSLRVKQNW